MCKRVYFLFLILLIAFNIKCNKLFVKNNIKWDTYIVESVYIYIDPDISVELVLDEVKSISQQAYTGVTQYLNINDPLATVKYFLTNKPHLTYNSRGIANIESLSVCIYFYDYYTTDLYTDFLHGMLHETIHVFSENYYGPSMVTFFIEGLAESFSEIDIHSKAKEIENIENLPIDQYAIYTKRQFYDAPFELYTISGSFIKYIIDEIGMGIFLNAYGKIELENFFSDFEYYFGVKFSTAKQNWLDYITSI